MSVKESKYFLSALISRNPLFLLALFLFFLNFLLKIFSVSCSYVVLVLSVIILGYKNIKNGFFCAIRLKFSEETLMAFSSIAAIIIGDAFEAFLLLFFFIIGETLEDVAKEQSRKSIREVSQIIPDSANLFVDENIKLVDSSEVEAGDCFFVYPFEKIPCDGIVIEGSSKVNNSFVTGESELVDVSSGKEVLSGSVNTYGSLKVKAVRAAADSTAGRILELIEKGYKNKANTERFISKFSKKYVSSVIFISAFLFVLLLFFYSLPFVVTLKRTLSFMVAACPCSIVISIPLALFRGIGVSAKSGVLFKGGRYLEQLDKVNTVFLDKTGTLTENCLELDKVYSFKNFAENEILSLFFAVEIHSKHPMAKMLKNVEVSQPSCVVENVSELPGFGVISKVNGKEVICGNLELMNKNNVRINERIMDLPVYVAVDGEIVGGISFKNKIRDSAVEIVKKLATMNIKSIILSGDNKHKTEEVARKCNVEKFYFSLLPEDKLEILKRAQKNGCCVAFLGDGANDAPSLAAADCGIAMGLGSDIALESAGIVLKNSDISLLPYAVKMSKKVMHKIRINIAFAIIVKVLILIFSFFSNVPMWLAVFADVGVTIISILNSTRIRVI